MWFFTIDLLCGLEVITNHWEKRRKKKKHWILGRKGISLNTRKEISTTFSPVTEACKIACVKARQEILRFVFPRMYENTIFRTGKYTQNNLYQYPLEMAKYRLRFFHHVYTFVTNKQVFRTKWQDTFILGEFGRDKSLFTVLQYRKKILR